MSEAISNRTQLPLDTKFSLPNDVEPLAPEEKYQTTVSLGIGVLDSLVVWCEAVQLCYDCTRTVS